MAKQTNRQEAKRMDEKTIERPGYWAVLPAQVRYDPELPASAKILYAEISSLTDKTGYCYASNEYFMKLYGCADRTLQRLLRALEARGYITIQDGNGGAGRRKIYAGINPVQQNPDKNVGVTPTKMSGPPDKNVTHNSKENKKENNPPSSPPKGTRRGRKKKTKSACDWEPEMFERFWKLYPRGEGKGEARYAWDALEPDRKLMMEMSEALKCQKLTDEWLRGVGVPWAVRWLNERRWEWDVGVSLEDSAPPLHEEVRW